MSRQSILWKRRKTKKGPRPAFRRAGARRKRLAARYVPALLGAVSSPRGTLTAEFGMGSGVTSPPEPPAKGGKPGSGEEGGRGPCGGPFIRGRHRLAPRGGVAPARGEGGQASRPIRTDRVRPSRALRLPPVNPVVSRGPSGRSRAGTARLRGGLALRCLQRLSRRGVATRRCPSAGQPEHQRPPAPGPDRKSVV